ncbi:MAG TPA: cation:proton antiporter [Thermoanaerobaculia bacterium]|nr:cation:proton antiporter [Thermoanaerobaculia bacterium]
MLEPLSSDPSVTISIALFAGMVVQILAERLKIPSIILLLAAGVLLGPDGAGVVQPSSLGAGLHNLVGFGVAVILFEGAMNLRWAQLRREANSIQRLATLGVMVTAICGTLAAWGIMRWPLSIAVIFGALVTVTGPTVITPLVRRMRLQSRIATIAQAEGIFVDAIGAILAVVMLEIVISREGGSLAAGAGHALLRMLAGVVFGLIGGFALAGLLRVERLIPEAMQRVFTLALVLALFHVSNAITSESGIMAVIVAGLVAGNIQAQNLVELREFKEQLTVLLLGLLFVLLSADVRIAEIEALGWPAWVLVAVLIVVVRPLNVWVAAARSDLTPKEKTFLSVMAPRGIVAAAIGSLFAQTLDAEGIAGGNQLRALIFLVISVTVIAAGVFGTLFAHFLKLRRPASSGFVLLGAQPIGRQLGKTLLVGGEDVVLIDSNPHLCRAAEAEGLRIIYGSGLSETVLQRADLETRRGAMGVTTNDEVNLLFARRARKVYKTPRAWVAIHSGHLNVTAEVVRQFDTRLLFGAPRRLEPWNLRLDRNQAMVRQWVFAAAPPAGAPKPSEEALMYLPLAVGRGRSMVPVDDETAWKKGDILHALVWSERESEAADQLTSLGFDPAQDRSG